MNKSTAYKVAQIAVLKNDVICVEDKLAILRVLMESEDLALYCEKQEREKKEREKQELEKKA